MRASREAERRTVFNFCFNRKVKLTIFAVGCKQMANNALFWSINYLQSTHWTRKLLKIWHQLIECWEFSSFLNGTKLQRQAARDAGESWGFNPRPSAAASCIAEEWHCISAGPWEERVKGERERGGLGFIVGGRELALHESQLEWWHCSWGSTWVHPYIPSGAGGPAHLSRPPADWALGRGRGTRACRGRASLHRWHFTAELRFPGCSKRKLGIDSGSFGVLGFTIGLRRSAGFCWMWEESCRIPEDPPECTRIKDWSVSQRPRSDSAPV